MMTDDRKSYHIDTRVPTLSHTHTHTHSHPAWMWAIKLALILGCAFPTRIRSRRNTATLEEPGSWKRGPVRAGWERKGWGVALTSLSNVSIRKEPIFTPHKRIVEREQRGWMDERIRSQGICRAYRHRHTIRKWKNRTIFAFEWATKVGLVLGMFRKGGGSSKQIVSKEYEIYSNETHPIRFTMRSSVGQTVLVSHILMSFYVCVVCHLEPAGSEECILRFGYKV